MLPGRLKIRIRLGLMYELSFPNFQPYSSYNQHSMKRVLYTFLLATIVIPGLFAQVSQKDSLLYFESIAATAYPAQNKISNNLIAITKSNKDLVWKTVNGQDYVLVVVWMSAKNVGYYRPYDNEWGFYNTGEFPMWVTAAPELLNRIKKEKTKNVNRRLQQMLGLSPTKPYDYFIEIWVNPDDLQRPCPDKEVTDTTCGLCFPAHADSTYIPYKQWYNANILSSYYSCGLFSQSPWTQLGYTYDWSPKNKSHIGLSEFLIPKNKNVVVKKIYTTEEYLKK